VSARIDHAAEALACEEAGLSVMRKHEMAPHMEAVMQFDLARLHAQLALVEQQRIANLIAYWQLHTPRSAQESFEHRHIEVSQIDIVGDRSIDSLVREGLGL
jgi:cyclopropane fatty-acyl-phospholipid synthase-like methyltransferase